MKRLLPVILFLVSAVCQAQSGTIHCTVFIDTVGYTPLQNIVIQVYEKDILKASELSDEDGIAYIKPLAPGRYNVSIIFPGRDTTHITGVLVGYDKTTSLKVLQQRAGETIAYKPPLIDKYAAKTSMQLIEKMPPRIDKPEPHPNVYIRTEYRSGLLVATSLKVQRIYHGEDANETPQTFYANGEYSIFLEPGSYYVYPTNQTCVRKAHAAKRYKLVVADKPVICTLRVRYCLK